MEGRLTRDKHHGRLIGHRDRTAGVFHRSRICCRAQNDGKHNTQRRVQTNVGLSLKQQLRLLESIKKSKEGANKTVQRTKFRQRKDIKEEAENRRQRLKVDEVEMHTYQRKRKLGQTSVFIVDGYNVCGSWSKLKQLFRTGQIEKSRNLLLEELSFFVKARIIAVFDAADGSSSKPEKVEVNDFLTVIYVSDADEYIDKEVKKLAANEDLDLCVVTSDNLTRSLAQTGGARLMTSKDFVHYLSDLKSRNANEMKMLQAKDEYQGTLRFALDTATKSKLIELRASVGDYKRKESDSEGDVVKGNAETKNCAPKSKRVKGKAKRKKTKSKFKAHDVASDKSPSNLGNFADNKLLKLRNKLNPYDDNNPA